MPASNRPIEFVASPTASMTQAPLSHPRHSPSFCAPALAVIVLAFGVCLGPAHAQSPASSHLDSRAALPDAPQPQTGGAPSLQDAVTVRNSLRIFAHDEEAIWTSPARLRPHDLEWLAPLAIAVGAAVATDHRAMNQLVSHDANFNHANVTASNVLIGGMIAAPVVLFAAGHAAQDDRARETGILGGEAVADGLVVEQGLKLVFWRERPNVDQSRGRFFQSGAGVNSSFPSAHATLAFAAASAIATEYRNPWTQIAAYSGATAVGVTRVLGREHFPSDVLVGATTGWLIGHYVVKRHHKGRE